VALVVAGAVLLIAAMSGRNGSLVHASDARHRQQTATGVSESATATVTCTFRQGGDRVSLTTGPAYLAVTAGWWDQGKCPRMPAQVIVRLQARVDGHWHDIVWTSTAALLPGDRAPATFRCQNDKETRWRSVIDVDLFGRPDQSGNLVTPDRRLACGPEFSSVHEVSR
jgi:hypothetical protein